MRRKEIDKIKPAIKAGLDSALVKKPKPSLALMRMRQFIV
jgi:hypothetical protein